MELFELNKQHHSFFSYSVWKFLHFYLSNRIVTANASSGKWIQFPWNSKQKAWRVFQCHWHHRIQRERNQLASDACDLFGPALVVQDFRSAASKIRKWTSSIRPPIQSLCSVRTKISLPAIEFWVHRNVTNWIISHRCTASAHGGIGSRNNPTAIIVNLQRKLLESMFFHVGLPIHISNLYNLPDLTTTCSKLN